MAVLLAYWTVKDDSGTGWLCCGIARPEPENPDVYFMDVGLTKLSRDGQGGIVDELLRLIERY